MKFIFCYPGDYFSSRANLPFFTVSMAKAVDVEAVMVRRGKVEHAGGADEALQVLDGGPDLFPVRPGLL